MKIVSCIKAFWYKLGQLLNKIMSPFLLGVIYFFVIVPYAIIYHLFLYKEGKEKTTNFKERNHLYTSSEMKNMW